LPSENAFSLFPHSPGVIRRTFLILPTIGEATERKLWREGLLDWDCFLRSKSVSGISSRRKERLDGGLHQASVFLERGEVAYFTRLLPSREHWRFLEEAGENVAYLDIETDGLGPKAVVTMVGVHRPSGSITLVRDIDLNEESLSASLRGCKMLVTFNGASFDLPMIEREFPFSMPRVPHFDLRHGCARIGLTGGLKSVERQVGIFRARELEYMTGEEAVYLWHLWKRKGNENALKLLKRYNLEDTKNLVPIAGMVYRQLRERALDAGAMV